MVKKEEGKNSFKKDWLKKLSNEELRKLINDMFETSDKKIKELKKTKKQDNHLDLQRKRSDEIEESKIRFLSEKDNIGRGKDSSFVLKATINHFNVSPQQQKAFFGELETLMKKYGVFEVNGVLIRKF